MAMLVHNAVLRLNAEPLIGLFRVIAVPVDGSLVYLGYVQPIVADPPTPATPPGQIFSIGRPTLSDWLDEGDAQTVELSPPGLLLQSCARLNTAQRQTYERRLSVMGRFLDHQTLASALSETGGIGTLVREAVDRAQCSRSSVYRLWTLLCLHGFEAASLYPRFDQCGAPGVIRPYVEGRDRAGRKTRKEELGETLQYTQTGMSESMRKKIVRAARPLMLPGRSFPKLYDRIIEVCFVTQYVESNGERKPVAPAQGTYPTKRQVRHLLETEFQALERLRARTTDGHFERSLRGLHGKSYEGVAGPGHCYAIDSTIGDVYLRSSVNRAWIIGRPIVYVVVDVWSTAIVGFYVCLRGPSWSTASSAVFSASVRPELLGELWEYVPIITLSPTPTLPHSFIADRGEYVCEAARRRAQELGFNWRINAAYRPDYKGIVEVLNRIAKDTQYTFVPGAINARRKELELKTDAKESVLTLREYAHYLHGIFGEYNLVACRAHRLTTEMIAADVQPSPSGLWRFGHSVGIGYQKAVSESRLITTLLPEQNATVLRNGLFLGKLQYDSPLIQEQQWTARARNFGSFHMPVHHFPGTTSQIWLPDSTVGELHKLSLHRQSRISSLCSFDEWVDALAVESLKRVDREHARLGIALERLTTTHALIESAREKTRAAEAIYDGPQLAVREARALEQHVQQSGSATPPQLQESGDSLDEYEQRYQELIEAALRGAEGEIAA